MSEFYLRQLEVGPMENFSYLIGDLQTRQCVLVDPAWQVADVLEIARKDEMQVMAGLVTHTHFDHCNQTKELLEKTKSKIYVHKSEGKFLEGMKSEIVEVDAGYKLEIGKLTIEFLHTPGHTPGSQCFLVRGNLISGDTLFINACGRCDLPGGNPEQMYQSLQNLRKLEDQTILLPGHNYGESNTSTIGLEKLYNPYCKSQPLQDFLRYRMG